MTTLPISKFGENLPVTGLVAFSQAAVGIGIGMLVAEKFGRSSRQRTALALIGAGAAAVIPFFVGVYNRVQNRPHSSRGMRRRLDSIRDDVGFTEHNHIF